MRRFAAQRRIFRIEGRPFVATRDGGFFETWATLTVLIEKHRPMAPQPRTGTNPPPAQEHAVQGCAGPPPGPARLDEGDAERDHRGADPAAVAGRDG